MKITGGVVPALLTPFTKGNKINEAELRKLVRMNINKGVHGFYVGGSTAEAFLLSTEERKQILECVISEAFGKCFVIAHIGCISTDQSIELAEHAQIFGANAVSSIAPFYYGFTQAEIKSHYDMIAGSVDLPVIIYNAPAFSGVTLGIDTITEYIKDKRFAGIKHTSKDLYQLERIKRISKDFIVFNGYDEVFLGGVAMGADGGIGSTYNIMAEKFIDILRFTRNDEVMKAYEIQQEVNDIIEVMVKVGVLQAEKELLNMMGMEFGHCRRPFKKIDDHGKSLLKKITDKLMI